MLTVWAVSSSEHFGPVSIRPSVSLSHHAYTQNDSRGAAPTAKDEGKRVSRFVNIFNERVLLKSRTTAKRHSISNFWSWNIPQAWREARFIWEFESWLNCALVNCVRFVSVLSRHSGLVDWLGNYFSWICWEINIPAVPNLSGNPHIFFLGEFSSRWEPAVYNLLTRCLFWCK